MTLEKAIRVSLKAVGGTREWHESNIKVLVALGVLKLDDMEPEEEYELAINGQEIMDQLKT